MPSMVVDQFKLGIILIQVCHNDIESSSIVTISVLTMFGALLVTVVYVIVCHVVSCCG